MQIIKEKLEIDEVLKKKVNNLLKFNNIKDKLENGFIISLINTNIAYIKPHKLVINETTYLFFNECEDVYINDLSRSIPLKDKIIRLKDAYLNDIISLDEYKEDKNCLEIRIKGISKKIKEEQDLEQYNFTFEDIMLKRDIESIKCFINPFYELNFRVKWNELSIAEKQELITSYIESIEVTKNDKDIKIKQINFRKTFIEEYVNLFNNGGINRNQEIKANNIPINIEVSIPMTREEIKRYIKKLQLNYPIDYQELKKEQINEKQFILKYSKGNYFNEPFKLIPIIDKFKITSYGLIEVPVSPTNIVKIDV